jgi:selenide,water dikinase
VGQLPLPDDPNVLVGTATGDDAAVYRLTAELALVLTTDFFTPIVNDPYTFGAIAAANALSDVYAMGARPLTALNLVAFPVEQLPLETLTEILRGGGEKAREAGIAVVGGHSIDDAEPKYGLAVAGIVHPDRIVTNAGGRAQDRLYLTKAIGTGIITTAIKRETAPPAAEEAAIASMLALNRDACEAMLEVGAHAATDITGFGFLGHLRQLALASGLAARVQARAVPLLQGARELAQAGAVPGGTARNEAFLADWVTWPAGLPAVDRTLLCDAQTSGGLLIAVPPARATALEAALRQRNLPVAPVGVLVEGRPGSVLVE